MIRKLRLISKLITSKTGKQLITIHILLNIQRNKDDQTMKFNQLIEYNMKYIFLEKSYKKSDWETSPRSFSKKSKLSIYLDQQSKMLYCLFFIYVQVEVYQSILKLRCWSLALTLYKAFLKSKKRPEASLPVSFSEWFLKKYISHV